MVLVPPCMRLIIIAAPAQNAAAVVALNPCVACKHELLSAEPPMCGTVGNMCPCGAPWAHKS